MAQRNVTTIIDDLTGKELPDGTGETVKFSLDGVRYELDVNSRGAQRLRSAFAPYVKAGRRAPGAAPRAQYVGRETRLTRLRFGHGPTPTASPSTSAAGSRLLWSPSSRRQALVRPGSISHSQQLSSSAAGYGTCLLP